MTVSYHGQPVLTGAADVTAAIRAQTPLSRRHGVRICRILGRPVLVGVDPSRDPCCPDGEEIGHFDQEYRQVMTEAAESLDLSGVLAMLERWRRVAWSTQDDPDVHRKMLETADRRNSGEDVRTVPWEQVRPG
jgi:hypothetical protein